MTVEEIIYVAYRVALLENQVHEVFDILEQISKDLELTEVNINRVLKGLRPEKPTSAPTLAVQELTFTTLKYDATQGAQLGDYEIAYQANNTGDKFQQAYNILEKNNATIKNRYHGADYAYSYWIYGAGKIYRQKIKEHQQ